MAMKRKRSFSDEHSPASTTSTFSTSTRCSTSPTPLPRHFNFIGSCMQDDQQAAQSRSWQSWHLDTCDSLASSLHSRTRKRWRDNRPGEGEVYQSTLQKLYSAQRLHPSASPIPSHSPDHIDSPAPVTEQSVQKSTLHSFWNIPSHSTSTTPSHPPPQISAPPHSLDQDMDDAEADGDGDLDMGLGSGGPVGDLPAQRTTLHAFWTLPGSAMGWGSRG